MYMLLLFLYLKHFLFIEDLPFEQVHEHSVKRVPEYISEKRITCNEFSHSGWDHSSCIQHCRRRGYRGGYCDTRAICNCI